MSRRRWHLGARTTAGFALALALFAGAGIGAVREQHEMFVVGNSSIHTLQLIDQARLLRTLLVDAETGQRGYLLTGARHYLEPYEAAVRQLPAALARLQELTRDDPDQRPRLDELAQLTQAESDELALTIGLRDREGLAAALRVVETDAGKATMDRVRDVLARVEADERAHYDRRIALRAVHDARTNLLVKVALAAGVALAGVSLADLNRRSRDCAQAEREARAERERLDVTLRSIGDGVIATGLDARVTFLNPVAEALTGWPLADAAGRPLDEVFRIVNEESRGTVASPVGRALREGIVVGLANHTILLARDGREIPIDDSAAPIRDDGAPRGAVLVFRDIRERRHAEAERERLQRVEAERAEAAWNRRQAEAANRSKDEFLAVLSHELRSPLHAMLGWTSILEKDLAAGRDVRHAIAPLLRNIQLQTQLVNDLLDVSRIVSGKLAIEADIVDLGAVVDTAVENARPAAEAKRVELHASLAPLSGVVVGDEKRLEQVLGNLLDNALKFTPKGGCVAVSLTDGRGEATVVVADSGPGIDPAFLPYVFDRFRQADASTTRRHGGLGLGLSIVKTLVELHGGQVDARNADGQGAEMTLRLPLRGSSLELPPRRELDEAPGALDGLRVLLVEDDADGREALRITLEQSGATAYACASAAEALDLVVRVVPDVLLSDVGMPSASGYDLIRRIRARPGPALPAIAITGFVTSEDRAAATRAGFDEHIAKPVNTDALIRRIAHVVRRARRARGGA